MTTSTATPKDSESRIAPLQALHPGNFALVMASGIISIGFGYMQQAWLSDALCVFAITAWLCLLLLSVLRLPVGSWHLLLGVCCYISLSVC